MMISCGTLDKCRIYTLLTTSNRATRVALLEKLKKKINILLVLYILL